MFFRDTRARLLEQNHNKRKTFEELVTLVSSEWKAADEVTRSRYMAAAKMDSERYVEEIREFRRRSADGAAAAGSAQVGLEAKRKNAGGLSGYTMFVKEEHARLKVERQNSGDDWTKHSTVEIARRWSILTEAEKASYRDKAIISQRPIRTGAASRVCGHCL